MGGHGHVVGVSRPPGWCARVHGPPTRGRAPGGAGGLAQGGRGRGRNRPRGGGHGADGMWGGPLVDARQRGVGCRGSTGGGGCARRRRSRAGRCLGRVRRRRTLPPGLAAGDGGHGGLGDARVPTRPVSGHRDGEDRGHAYAPSSADAWLAPARADLHGGCGGAGPGRRGGLARGGLPAAGGRWTHLASEGPGAAGGGLAGDGGIAADRRRRSDDGHRAATRGPRGAGSGQDLPRATGRGAVRHGRPRSTRAAGRGAPGGPADLLRAPASGLCGASACRPGPLRRVGTLRRDGDRPPRAGSCGRRGGDVVAGAGGAGVRRRSRCGHRCGWRADRPGRAGVGGRRARSGAGRP